MSDGHKKKTGIKFQHRINFNLKREKKKLI